MNSLGKNFVFTSFGESHGRAVGGVLDGVPAGVRIDMDMIREALDRRAGRVKVKGERLEVKGAISPRALCEGDEVEWLSGVLDGVTLGTPIAFIIRNADARSEDYDWLKHNYRPGHADQTYQEKYGIRDHRGGGRASARETASRVVAGAVAQQLLAEKNIQIAAQLVQVGTETNPDNFAQYIADVQQQGDSIGGIVECTITGLPVGVGEPIFDKLQSYLAYAMMSINACKGFADDFFSYEPYTANKQNFNIRAVWSPSEESGVSIPGEHIWKNTVKLLYLQMQYNNYVRFRSFYQTKSRKLILLSTFLLSLIHSPLKKR